MKILSIVGARPNFMKIAPLHRAFEAHPKIHSKILHTGQHYDEKMSDIFFNQLGLPKPHFYLGVGGGSHTWQKAHVMLKFEKVLEAEKPNLVLVVGDVNATASCSIVAVKMGIPVAHVEAGLRSGDRSMPEEINRIITDSISDFLFVTEHSGLVNLAREGVPEEKVFFVGNVMIDSLIHYRQKASQLDLNKIITNSLNNSTPQQLHNRTPQHLNTSTPQHLNTSTSQHLNKNNYILMTMHRPDNVDNEKGLRNIIQIIHNAVRHKRVIFPIHPRTSNSLKDFGLQEQLENIDGLILLEPQGYLEFLKLMENAALIITDSGGIQEETTFLQVPCMTFRDTTERPITVEFGTNFLMKDLNPETVRIQMEEILKGNAKKGIIPPLWDGQAAERIAEILVGKLSESG